MKKRIVVLFLFFVVAVLLCCKVVEAVENEYTWLIEPKYEIGRTFSEGLWPVRKNGKFGYVDSADTVIIDFQFLDVGSFENGRANVAVAPEQWGLIDLKGKFIWKPINKFPLTFVDGRARVQSGDLLGFIDPSGDVLIPPRYQRALNFSEGLAAVKIDNLWQYVDSIGEAQIKLIHYKECGSFSNGLAAVYSGDLWGYINLSGDLQVPLRYLKVKDFASNRAIVSEKSGWGVIDSFAAWVIPPQYTAIEGFNDNRHFFVRSGDLWGVTDSDGKLIMEYQFQDVKIFEHEDIFYKNSPRNVRVNRNGKVGFLNENLEWMLSPNQYPYPSGSDISGYGVYTNGVAFISGLDISDYVAIDTKGQILFELPFVTTPYPLAHSRQFFVIQTRTPEAGKKVYRCFLVNRHGKTILSPIFETVFPSDEDPVSVSIDGLYGLLLLNK